MRNHFWVLFLSPHGFCSSLSDSQPRLAGDGCPQPQLAGDGCPQLFSYQEPHRETVMNQFQSPVPRRGRVWLSLGQVSAPGPASCGKGQGTHNGYGYHSHGSSTGGGECCEKRKPPGFVPPEGRFLCVHSCGICRIDSLKLGCPTIMVYLASLGSGKVFSGVE